jgi:hypothetical protein
MEGVNEWKDSVFPALVKAGCREAAGRFVQEINSLINTTLALRATPPPLRRALPNGKENGPQDAQD